MPTVVHEVARAKVNLFLHILGRRSDGYHRLESLVVFPELGDNLEILPAAQFSFSCTGPFAGGVPVGPENLVWRAAEAFFARYRQIKNRNGKRAEVEIRLRKNLPVGAGIGGGSADAAAALRGMNDFFGAPFTISELAELGAPLGADVPMCVHQRTAVVRGIGACLTPYYGLPLLDMVLINPGEYSDTGAVYGAYRDGGGVFSAPITVPETMTLMVDFKAFLDRGHNDLQQVASRQAPLILDVLARLKDARGCYFAAMSGSGATCFGLFESAPLAANAAEQVKRYDHRWWAVHCRVPASVNAP